VYKWPIANPSDHMMMMKWANIFIYTYTVYRLFPCRLHYIHWQKWPRRRDCAGKEGNISMKIDCLVIII
jgi:hypothetical protein